MKLARRRLKWAGDKERLGCGRQAKSRWAESGGKTKTEVAMGGLREERFRKSGRQLGC